jgi:hypothetical protein
MDDKNNITGSTPIVSKEILEQVIDCIYPDDIDSIEKKNNFDGFFTKSGYFLRKQEGGIIKPRNEPEDFEAFEDFDNIMSKLYELIPEKYRDFDSSDKNYDLYYLIDEVFDDEGNILENVLANYRNLFVKEKIESIS